MIQSALAVPNTNPAPPCATIPQLLKMDSFLPEWQRVSEELYLVRKSGQNRGPVTGLRLLDQILGGALLPGLHGIHGTPGIGKSSFCIQVAATCGSPALYVTCEMPPLELFRRVVSRETKTYVDRLRNGTIEPSDAVSKYLVSMQKASNLFIADAQRAPVSLDWLTMAAEAVKGDHEHLLIVVDSLHSWSEGAYSGLTEYDRLAEAMNGLRQLSSKLSCSVLAIYERNRSSMDHGGLSAGAGNRKLEYAPDTVMELNKQDSREEQDENNEIEMAIRIRKNRNGNLGQVRAVFNGGFQSFSEID